MVFKTEQALINGGLQLHVCALLGHPGEGPLVPGLCEEHADLGAKLKVLEQWPQPYSVHSILRDMAKVHRNTWI